MFIFTEEEKTKIQYDIPLAIEELSSKEGFTILVKGLFAYMEKTSTLPKSLHNTSSDDFEDEATLKFIAQEVFQQMLKITTT